MRSEGIANGHRIAHKLANEGLSEQPYVQVALTLLLLAGVPAVGPLLSTLGPIVDTKLIAQWAFVVVLLVGVPLYAARTLRNGYFTVWGYKVVRADAAPVFWLHIVTCGIAVCGGLLLLLQLLDRAA